MTKPREYTTNEIREMFLDQVRGNIEYWNKVELKPENDNQKYRIEGAIFSTLVLLDGGTNLSGWIVAPCPHPEDKQFHIDNQSNYFPENHDVEIKGDIAGCLHELFHK